MFAVSYPVKFTFAGHWYEDKQKFLKNKNIIRLLKKTYASNAEDTCQVV